jgi:hypothetical protein
MNLRETIKNEQSANDQGERNEEDNSGIRSSAGNDGDSGMLTFPKAGSFREGRSHYG